MRVFLISPRQTPIVVMILALVVVFTAIYIRYVQSTPAEQAVKSGSLARLTATIAKHPALINKPDKKNGLTPLHWAVIEDRTNMVEFLLSRGADVRAADRYGWTPLHKAVAFNRVKLAKMLLDNGADPLAFGIRYGVIRFAPIHLAAEAGFTDMVKLFLDGGVDINLRTEGQNRVTCLHIASGKGRAEAVELLLKSGADVNARDSDDKTPMFWARRTNQDEIIDMLRIYDAAE